MGRGGGRVGEADRIGHLIDRVRAMKIARVDRFILIRFAPRPVCVPHDEGVALATHNVVRAVPVRSEVDDGAALLMRVRVRVLPMQRVAEAAAEG